jgi:hypothetical protein
MPASSRRLAELTLAWLLFVTAFAISSLAAAADKPPVRAITAFIDLDPARYQEQFEDTANRLRTPPCAAPASTRYLSQAM